MTDSVTRKESIMIIITTWNLKGGTGKTTTTFNLAANYAKEGKRVLLVDLDMQANLTSFFDDDIVKHKENKPDIASILNGASRIEEGIYRSRFENLNFIKGSNDIMQLNMKDINILGSYLSSLTCAYDICMIDCHPDVSVLTENALAIADLVIVPIFLDGFSRDNLNLVIKELISLENKCGEIKFRIFVNRLRNLKSQKAIYMDLVKNHDYSVMNTSIAEYSGIQSALLKHKPLYMHRKKSSVNEDYRELAQEILSIAEVE